MRRYRTGYLAVILAASLTAQSRQAKRDPLERCSFGSIDRPAPTLLSDVEPFRFAVSRLNYAGNVIASFTVTHEGTLRGLRITPSHLQTHAGLLQEVNQWRFCPAFVRGEKLEKAVEFTIHIPRPE